VLTFSRKNRPDRASATTAIPVPETGEREEEEFSPERAAIVERLKRQGAVQVLPSRYGGAGGAGAGAGAGQSREDLAPDRPYEDVQEYLALERLRKQIKNAKSAGVTPDLPEPLRKRLEAHEKGAIPMAKWYKKRAAEYRKEAEARAKAELEWYHPTRERAGARDRDVNMEQDIEDHLTQEHLRKMNPRLRDVRQRFRNMKDDYSQHWGRKAAGKVPVAGPFIEHAINRAEDIDTRDAMLGMAQVQTDEQLAGQTRGQAQAIDKTIDAGWIKAGISSVTGVAGNFVPVPGAGAAANFGGGMLVDKAYSDSRSTVQEMTARMRARKDMRKDEFREYEDEQEFILLEKLAEQFRKGGQGDEDSGMMSTLTPELQRRLMAHMKGMIPNRNEMEYRAKLLNRERERQFKAGLEPKPETGILAKFKRFFSRKKS